MPVSSHAAQVVGDRIRRARADRGITQMELAELCGMHFTTLGRVERGETDMKLSTLLWISDVLEIDPAGLVRGISTSDLPEHETVPTVSDYMRFRRERATRH